jgi:hypothetical protein
MLAEQLQEHLAKYDEWKSFEPNTKERWRHIYTLDLRRPVELLFADGSTVECRPCISNPEWVMEGYRPVAWRWLWRHDDAL